MKMRKYLNMQKSNLQEAIFQVVFLINNNRYESALDIIRINEISLSELSENKSLKSLDEFNAYVKKLFPELKSS